MREEVQQWRAFILCRVSVTAERVITLFDAVASRYDARKDAAEKRARYGITASTIYTLPAYATVNAHVAEVLTRDDYRYVICLRVAVGGKQAIFFFFFYFLPPSSLLSRPYRNTPGMACSCRAGVPRGEIRGKEGSSGESGGGSPQGGRVAGRRREVDMDTPDDAMQPLTTASRPDASGARAAPSAIRVRRSKMKTLRGYTATLALRSERHSERKSTATARLCCRATSSSDARARAERR